MPKLKNVSGSDRTVPSLGGRVVVNGEVVEVSDDEVYGFTCQEANWKPADKATQKIHDDAHAAQAQANNPQPVPAEEPKADEAAQKEND